MTAVYSYPPRREHVVVYETVTRPDPQWKPPTAASKPARPPVRSTVDEIRDAEARVRWARRTLAEVQEIADRQRARALRNSAQSPPESPAGSPLGASDIELRIRMWRRRNWK